MFSTLLTAVPGIADGYREKRAHTMPDAVIPDVILRQA
jgi:hypothetical protein